MTPRLFSRARLVVPPVPVIISFMLMFLLAEAVFLVMRANPPAGRVPPEVGLPTLVLFLAAVAYGGFRVAAFHPVFRDRYRAWLESTPWNLHKPLPLGPVNLIWEDGLFIGALILLDATQPVQFTIQLLCTFMMSYIFVLILAFVMVDDGTFAYVMAFTVGLAVWFLYQPLFCITTLAAVYLFAYGGLRRSLARFPWGNRKALRISNGDIRLEYEPAREPCGWPHDRIMGDIVWLRAISRLDALLASMLASWWLFVLVSLIAEVGDRFLVSAVAFYVAMTFAPLARLVIYVRGYQSPLGFGARLLTCRWIIPGYDQVFVGPLCAGVAGVATLRLLSSCMVPLAISFDVAAGVVILVALITPPGLRRWRLTGKHRLAPILDQRSFGEKPKFIRVT